MKSKTIFWMFVAVALAQLAVPASMIVGRERTLRTGTAFKFRTAPVDPYDAFRGRYVALQFEERQGPVAAGEAIVHGDKVCAVLATDSAGFARVVEVRRDPPADQSYVSLRVAYPSNGTVYLQWPFDRYYMEESSAPAAETAYREHSRSGERDAWAVVRVRDGCGVIEGLYVGGQRIEEFVRQSPAGPR